MPAISPLRITLWLALIGVSGVAGWAAGRWAHNGMSPTNRTARPSTVQHPAPAVREPKVEPGSPAGKWMARVKTATSRDFATLLEELDALWPKDSHFAKHEAAQKWLLALWIGRDADAAVAYVAGKQDKFLGSAFGLVLGSVAPEKVAAILAGPHKNDLGEFFLSAALHSLATTDPREFLKLSLDKNAAGSPWIRNWPRALATLAETDPATAAAAWTAAGTKEPSRKSALFSILRTWTERDLKGARQWAESLTNEADRQLANHAWLGTLARRDPRAALKELASMDAGEFLPGNLESLGEQNASRMLDSRVEIVAALARHNLPEALAAMQSLLKSIKAPAQIDAALDAFVSPSDPKTALRTALVKTATPGLPHDPALLLPALKNLANGNGGQGGAEPDPAMALLLFHAKIAGWNADTALDAAKLLADEADTPDRNEMLSAAVKQAGLRDPGKAVDALSTLPDDLQGSAANTLLWIVDGSKTELLQQIVPLNPPTQWAPAIAHSLAAAPEQNASIVAALPLNAHARVARYDFTEQWGKQDPEAAAQWVAGLPQDRGTVEAARGLTNAWAQYDDTAATAWADSLPPGNSRDGAALGLASGLRTREPEAAWHWAAAISDPELSADAYWNVARAWGNQAPEEFRTAFSAALDRGGYGGDIKTRALRDLEKPPNSHLRPQGP